MNGLAVMLCVSVLGVQQTWRTTQEGQLEYVLQVEPTFLASLEQGETITSKLPSTAKEVHRLCLRISAADLKKAPQRTPQLPPQGTAEERAAQEEPDIPVAIVVDAQGRSEETTDVSHGWQVGADHRVQYLVQLSPDLLGKLREGDEIYMNVYPEAGQIQQFVVLAGKILLPRKSEKTHRHAPLTGQEQRLVAPAAAAEEPTVYGPMAKGPSATSPRSFGPRTAEGRNEPRANVPRSSEPPRLRNPPRYSVDDEGAEQPMEEPGEQPFAGRYAGEPQYGEAAEDRVPGAAPELFTTNPAEETTAEEQSEPAPLYGPARSAPPRATASDAPVFDRSQFADAPANRPRTTRATLTPPDDGNQYLPEEETRLSQPRAKFGAGDTSINNVSTTSAEDERAEVDNNRTASVENPKGRTGLGKGGTKSAKGLAIAATDGQETTPPYWPLFFTCCALFLSIGGNMYLGWTAAEFYSRYRKAVERMRGESREADRD
ncbi:MAG: hypothetical protein ACR2FY_17845 [Pirellulaceae bacterium]